MVLVGRVAGEDGNEGGGKGCGMEAIAVGRIEEDCDAGDVVLFGARIDLGYVTGEDGSFGQLATKPGPGDGELDQDGRSWLEVVDVDGRDELGLKRRKGGGLGARVSLGGGAAREGLRLRGGGCGQKGGS